MGKMSARAGADGIACFIKISLKITRLYLLVAAFCILASTERVNAQAGALDLTFNPTDVGFGNGDGINGTIYSVAFQPDGKAVLGGSFGFYNGVLKSGVVRLNADGSRDNTFDAGIGTDDEVRTVILQSDGKIIIGGHFRFYNGTYSSYIARLNGDGSLDNTFNSGTVADNHVYSAAGLHENEISYSLMLEKSVVVSVTKDLLKRLDAKTLSDC